jgi:hypothetical protein
MLKRKHVSKEKKSEVKNPFEISFNSSQYHRRYEIEDDETFDHTMIRSWVVKK